ncbi:MAG: lipocalin family protein [Bacteriovoracaceae bacterium]|nr:lipocalin family protein [Bacteriovoracaceae bacterium]
MSNSLLGLILLLSTTLMANAQQPELKTVKNLDLERYQGLWYELYRLPNRFEEGCINVSATYKIKGQKLEVANKCILEATGEEKIANGTAFVENETTRASLKVSFVPFFQRWGLFAGDYNVLEVGPNYEYALVGSKDRNYLWILSRTKQLDLSIVEELKSNAIRQSFDLSELIKTPQS